MKIGLNMYTAILRRVLSMYTIILRRVNRMKIFIFVFVYIKRLGSLVAQGIGGLYRTCFGTRNRYGVGTTVPVLVSKTGTILRVESGVCLSKLAEILSNVYFGISLSMQV